MTQRDGYGSPPGGRESRMQAVKEQSSNIGQNVMQAGGKVTQTAVGEGRELVAESGQQGRKMLNEASSRMQEQADAQQKRAAERLRALGDELQSMSSRDGQQGVASDLVRQASGTAHQAADWLQQREPGAVVNEVREYARRHPGMFLAGAAVAGMLAGRLTRTVAPMSGMAGGDGGSGGGQPANPNTQPAAAPTPTHTVEPTGHPAPERPDGQPVIEPGRVPQAHTEAR